MKRPSTSRAGLVAILILALTACDEETGDGAGATSGGAVEKGGTAVVAEVADISTPMMIVATTVLDGNLSADAMNMELLRGDWRDGRLVFLTADESPVALARSYEHLGADSSTLRFHMRSDVKWSDGHPLTAHDVVFTYRLVGEPALASPRQDYVEHLDSVVAEDDSTVTFHFDRRYPEMVNHAAIAPIPRHVYEGVPPAELRTHATLLDPANGKLVVSGPFMIGQWLKGDRVVLVPNPYFQPQPNLGQIVIRVIPEPTTRLVELQTGTVDLVQNVAFDQLERVKAQPGTRLEKEEKRFYDYVAYNPVTVPAFADPEIRRALGMALNVPQIIQALQMSEFAVPAGGPYPPIFKELYDERLMPPLAYDSAGAARILDARGWRDSNGDGIRDKAGKPFRFRLVTNAGNQRRGDASQMIQQQWRRLGIDVQLQTLEFNTMMQKLMNREYDAVLSGWQVALSPDISSLFAADSPLNITGYRNPTVAALFEKALSQPSVEEAVPVWREAASLLARDQPYTWLYFFDSVDAVRDRLRDTEIDSYGLYNNTWEWWIPRSQQGTAGTAPSTTRDTAKE